MHYYKRNLGDYAKKAARLTILQHGVYNLLIDACYDRERFPTRAEAIDWVWASTPDEETAVDFVLKKFFALDPETGTYTQSRIAEEIAAYHAKAAINKRIAENRERTKNDSSTNRTRTVANIKPNQEPITNNQEPEDIRANARAPKRPAVDYSVWPETPSADVLADWVAMRKRLRADVSQTVVNQFAKELRLAVEGGYSVDHCLGECVASNWRGFKFSWLKNREAQGGQNQRSVKQTRSGQNEQAHREYLAQLERLEREEAQAAGGYLAGSVEPPAGQ